MRAKFDPAAAWDALPPEQQRLAGIAAVVETYAQLAALDADEATGIGFDAAEFHAQQALAALLRPRLAANDAASLPLLPDLAPLGVTACRQCGCTEEIGCPEGCDWIAEGEDLCTACAGQIPAVMPW